MLGLTGEPVVGRFVGELVGGTVGCSVGDGPPTGDDVVGLADGTSFAGLFVGVAVVCGDSVGSIVGRVPDGR